MLVPAVAASELAIDMIILLYIILRWGGVTGPNSGLAPF